MKKGFAVGIIALFIVSAVSPMVIGYETESNIVDCEKNISGMDKICYGYCINDPSGELAEGPVTFTLGDPQNITQLWETSSPSHMTGGAWWYDGWFCCEYGSGDLWRIDYDSGYMIEIGGGGDNLNGLTISDKVLGSSNTSLYRINDETGEQILIGDFGFSVSRRMGSISQFYSSILGMEYIEDQLYEIDSETGGLSYIGPLGIDIDSNAELEQERYSPHDLYLTSKGVLYKVDDASGECIPVGEFQGGAEISALVIEPDKHYIPRANFSWEPLNPQIGDIVVFNASSSYSVSHDIILYEWDWDNNLVFDENSTSPLTSYQWNEEGLFPVTLLIYDDDNSFDTQRYIINIGNQPPNKPEINGPTNGKAGITYNYIIKATDPDNDNISLFIDWGDGNITDWTSYVHGNITVNVSHSWSEKGTFNITVAVKDDYDAYNSSNLEVTMPKNHNMQFGWLENFPILNRLFNRFMERLIL